MRYVCEDTKPEWNALSIFVARNNTVKGPRWFLWSYKASPSLPGIHLDISLLTSQLLKMNHCVKKFSFTHDKPELFRVSQWGDLKTVSRFYLGYRFFTALSITLAATVVWILYVSGLQTSWFLYWTNESTWLLIICLNLDFALTLKVWLKQRYGEKLR